MTSLRIAEVAARSGISASTLRYYDQLGLVPSERSSNGYRAYSETVFDRLRFIDSARRLDLPLEEISSLLQKWENDPCASVKSRLRPLLTEHLHAVDETLVSLSELRDNLESARNHLDELPDRDERCDPSCAFLLRKTSPVACELGAGQLEQVALWRRLLSDYPADRISGGVRYRLPIALLAETSTLAASEQECCPFFGFDISLRGGAFTLTIRTPVEGLSLLAELTGIDELSESVTA
jgi:DNA-binding transcriptional MerR regulator